MYHSSAMTSERAELILILDDEPHIAEAMEMLLKTRGYRVRTASTCEEALRILQHENPDLLLADVNMPCSSGVDFVKELQSRGLLTHTPVIFVSAMARVQDIQAGLQAGARDYLTKPFDPAELITRVERVLATA
jgi:DNA-binding response OmpR family regulator